MTLTPEARVLLTESLRPPAGFAVDTAVATTYSLNLTALLLAPLSFALQEPPGGGELDNADPVRLLEAVRRYADKTTVFCQAGGIHVPAAYRSIVTFVEDSVVQVVAPREGAIFHPKVWAVRFADPAGNFHHRMLVLSRNMTMDRSWDTALVLEEEPEGAIAGAPLADFVEALPRLALRPIDAKRNHDIAGLASTLRTARFAPPSPFTAGELLPIGIADEPVWPFPPSANRLLAISPFLTVGALRELGSVADAKALVSRMESLELVGSDALDGWDPYVLQRLAEVEAGEEVGDAERQASEFAGAREGLHAKTFVLDLADNTSLVVTGSANLTRAPWGGNVEFGVSLTGPTAECGVARVLDGAPEAPGLMSVLEPAAVENTDGLDDPQIASTYEIEALHRAIAEAGLTVDVTDVGEGSVVAALTVGSPDLALGDTVARLISLPHEAQARPLSSQPSWTIARENLTPFVAIETTAGTGDARVTCRCVIKAELTGDVGDRRKNAIATVLRNKDDVLRYLVFLLGDPAYDALLEELAGAGGAGRWGASPGSSIDVALFEPLVRAAGRDEAALARIASAVQDLRASDDGETLLPDGFEELWDVVWTVHLESRQ